MKNTHSTKLSQPKYIHVHVQTNALVLSLIMRCFSLASQSKCNVVYDYKRQKTNGIIFYHGKPIPYLRFSKQEAAGLMPAEVIVSTQTEFVLSTSREITSGGTSGIPC